MTYFKLFEKTRIPTYDDPNQVQFGEVAFDNEKCSGCLLCINLCPANALEKEGNKPVLKKPGENECMGCGDCVAFCHEDAIASTKSLQCKSSKYKTLEHGELAAPRL